MVQARVLQAHSQVGAHLSRSGGGAAGALTEQHMVGVRRYDGPVGVGRPRPIVGGGDGGPGLQGEADGLRGGIDQAAKVVERPGKENSRRSREPFQPATGQEAEPVPCGGLQGQENRENHDGSGAFLLAYVQCLGQRRASLLEEGYLHQPLRTDGTEATGQVGQFLCGPAGVQAAPSNQDYSNCLPLRPAERTT